MNRDTPPRLSRSSSSRAQRASARGMAVTASTSAVVSETSAPAEDVASSSTLIPEPDSMQVDSDDAMLSRSNSVQPGDEEVSSARRGSLRRDIKGKGKERAAQVRIKEEPESVCLSVYDVQPPNQTVRDLTPAEWCDVHRRCSRTKTIVPHVAPLAPSFTATAVHERTTSGASIHQWM